MFKFLLMYVFVVSPGYQLNAVNVVGGFRSYNDCLSFAAGVAADLKNNPYYVKGTGTYQCEAEKR